MLSKFFRKPLKPSNFVLIFALASGSTLCSPAILFGIANCSLLGLKPLLFLISLPFPAAAVITAFIAFGLCIAATFFLFEIMKFIFSPTEAKSPSIPSIELDQKSSPPSSYQSITSIIKRFPTSQKLDEQSPHHDNQEIQEGDVVIKSDNRIEEVSFRTDNLTHNKIYNSHGFEVITDGPDNVTGPFSNSNI